MMIMSRKVSSSLAKELPATRNCIYLKCIAVLVFGHSSLGRLDKGILKSQVNFLKKTVSVVFDSEKTSLRKVAELLTRIGYEPHISLSNVSKKPKKQNTIALLLLKLAWQDFVLVI